MFVTVSDRVCLTPTWTLPKLKLVGFDPRAPAAMPAPLSAILKEGFEPSEVIVTVPLAAPVACGAKATVKLVL